MPVELVVPSVGESITQVEIGEWLKRPGEPVSEDEPVVGIETEKVTVELPAPASGTITEMLKRKGDKAAVSDVIGYMEPNGTSPAGRGRRDSQTADAKPQQKAGAPGEGLKAVETPTKKLDSKLPPSIAKTPTSREDQIVPMTPIRRRIAERLVEAQKTAALLTTFNQVDMSAVMALRHEYQERFRAKYQIKLGFMSFFVKTCIETLKLIPQLNAEVRGH